MIDDGTANVCESFKKRKKKKKANSAFNIYSAFYFNICSILFPQFYFSCMCKFNIHLSIISRNRNRLSITSGFRALLCACGVSVYFRGILIRCSNYYIEEQFTGLKNKQNLQQVPTCCHSNFSRFLFSTFYF